MAVKNPDTNGLFTTSDTSDDVALTAIGDSVKVRGRGKGTIKIGIDDGSVIALDQFAIQGRVVEGSGTWLPILSVWGAAAEDRVLIHSETDLAVTAHGAGNERAALVDFSGWAEVRGLSAQAGVTAAAVTRTLEILFAEEANKGGF